MGLGSAKPQGRGQGGGNSSVTLNLTAASFSTGQQRWTAEETAILAGHWKSGKTAAEIARTMGKTRNQVIGRVHRCGLASRKSPITGEFGKLRQPRQPLVRRPRPKGPLKRSEIVLPGQKRAPTTPRPAEILPPLGKGTCQWIEGDPAIDPTKCGAQAILGKAWCPSHWVRVYVRRDAQSCA